MLFKELTEYKETLCRLFVNSDDIRALLKTNDDTIKKKDLVYKQIFPYTYLPDIQKEENIYLCFDIEVPRINSNSNIMKDVVIYVDALVHQSFMETSEGIRTDLFANKIDELLNGSKDFGMGLALASLRRFHEEGTYFGIELQYVARDFNNPNNPVNNPNTW